MKWPLGDRRLAVKLRAGGRHGRDTSNRRGAGDENAGSDSAAMAKRITRWQAAEIKR
jgi:hypothetical protein